MLARALYAHCELDEMIPAASYTSVAEVMAWVMQLNHWLAEGGLPPEEPTALSVPEGMDPGPGEGWGVHPPAFSRASASCRGSNPRVD